MIREMNRAEAETVSVISRRSISNGWSEEELVAAMNNPQEKVFVYERSGELLGYAVICFAADEGEISSIAVDSPYRRKGVANALLYHIKAELKILKVNKLFLEVRESNFPAQQLYIRHGFLQVGTRKGYYDSPKEDALLLCWTCVS